MNACGTAGIVDLVISSIDVCVLEIVHEAFVEEDSILGYNTYVTSQSIDGDIFDIMPIDLDASSNEVVEAIEQTEDC